MIEPEIRASEVHVLLPDIRLERSECTARTGSPSSTSYVGDAGIRISRDGDSKQRGHEPRSQVMPRVSGIRPSRLFFVAQLVVEKMSLS